MSFIDTGIRRTLIIEPFVDARGCAGRRWRSSLKCHRHARRALLLGNPTHWATSM